MSVVAHADGAGNPLPARPCPSRLSRSSGASSVVSRDPPGSRSRPSARSRPGFPRRACRPSPGGILGDLLVPAIAVAALAALENLMSATVADGMSVGERHDSDRELFGQGIANLEVTPLFGGIPATAAITRAPRSTSAPARESRLAAITQSLAILLRRRPRCLADGSPSIPLAALAGRAARDGPPHGSRRRASRYPPALDTRRRGRHSSSRPGPRSSSTS